MTGKSEDNPEKKLSYMEALGMFQRAIKEITPEDVADAIIDQFDHIKIIEIQDMLYQNRKHQLEAKLKEAKEREAIEPRPPQKKGGKK
jgi:hypothetical protein